MEGMEDGDARPRQVRYQAALRPDCIHATPLLNGADSASEPGFDRGYLLLRQISIGLYQNQH